MPTKIDGDKVAHGEVKEVWFDRPYRTMWNRFGEPSEMPADQVNLLDLLQQGWTMYEPPPERVEQRPTGKLMRNGSIFEFGATAQDVSAAERARIERNPSVSTGAVTPTATYYSPQGDKFEGWPADPESIRQYFALGFSLTPPATPAKASGRAKPARLRVLKEA